MAICIEIFEKCELFATQLQSKKSTACSALAGSKILVNHLTSMRSTNKFAVIYAKVSAQAAKFSMSEPELLKPRKVPVRFDDGAAAHVHSTYEDFSRKEFFKILDIIIEAIKDR